MIPEVLQTRRRYSEIERALYITNNPLHDVYVRVLDNMQVDATSVIQEYSAAEKALLSREAVLLAQIKQMSLELGYVPEDVTTESIAATLKIPSLHKLKPLKKNEDHVE